MRSRWLAEVAPPLFGAIAEGAWISVFAAAVVAPLGGPGALGSFVPCLAAALVGLLAARLLPIAPWRPAALMGVALAVVVGGFLAGRALGVASGVGPQPVALYPVLGLCVLRGARQGDPSAGSHAIDTLVRRAPALLVGGWLLGLLVAGEGRSGFISAAAAATLVFVLAAALGLGTARLAALPRETRDQLHGNGAWLLLVVLVVACALAVALPVSMVAGVPIDVLASGIVGVTSSLVLGIAGALLSVLIIVVDLVAALLRGLFNISTITPTQPPQQGQQDQPGLPGGGEASDPAFEPLVAILIVVTLLVLAWYLARRWQGARRMASPPTDVPERRSIHVDARVRLPSVRLGSRLRSRVGPDDAPDAYRRLLHDWADVPVLARDPAETPADHAARLRATGLGAPALDLLAADYQLARFGDVPLSAAEHRRAVHRWRRLRVRQG